MKTAIYLIGGGFLGALIVVIGSVMRMGSICSRQEEKSDIGPHSGLNRSLTQWKLDQDAASFDIENAFIICGIERRAIELGQVEWLRDEK